MSPTRDSLLSSVAQLKANLSSILQAPRDQARCIALEVIEAEAMDAIKDAESMKLNLNYDLGRAHAKKEAEIDRAGLSGSIARFFGFGQNIARINADIDALERRIVEADGLIQQFEDFRLNAMRGRVKPNGN